MNHKRFLEWWENRTPAEWELQSMAFDFEEKHFADLRLTAPSIRKRLLRYQEQGHDGQWYETEDDIDVSIDGWIFRFRRFREGWLGRCDHKHQTIFVRPGLSNTEHRAALLHEMIHAYEFQLSPPFREWLLLDLHKRLSKRIKPARLRRYMDVSTHAFFHKSAHGLLFLFKSLDLDLRFKWQPGTVFGYGREDYFAERGAE